MTFDEILQIVIVALASFGGGAVIVVGLLSWLGNLWARHPQRGTVEVRSSA